MNVPAALGRTDAERLRVLRSVLDHATDAVLITEAEPTDEPGPRILYANAAFTRMTGYALEDVLGLTPRLLQGPRSDRATLDRLRAALKAWEPVVVELVNYRKDGTEFWVELAVAPVADETGWYTHWIAIQRDVTARKHAAQADEQGRAEVLELAVRGAALGELLERLGAAATRRLGRPAALSLAGDAPTPGATGGARLPIVGESGEVLGELGAAGPPPTAEEQAWLAGLAAVLIGRDRARATLHDALRRAEVLGALGDSLQRAQTPDEVASGALALLGPALGAQFMLVVRRDGPLLRLPTL